MYEGRFKPRKPRWPCITCCRAVIGRRLHSLTRAVAFAAMLYCVCAVARGRSISTKSRSIRPRPRPDGFKFELHSNSVTTASGTEAHNQLDP